MSSQFPVVSVEEISAEAVVDAWNVPNVEAASFPTPSEVVVEKLFTALPHSKNVAEVEPVVILNVAFTSVVLAEGVRNEHSVVEALFNGEE